MLKLRCIENQKKKQANFFCRDLGDWLYVFFLPVIHKGIGKDWETRSE